VGYASKSKKAAADGGYVPLLSVIMSYDQEEKIWKEHNCNQWGNCRFDGQTISMTVEQWMSAAGVTNLDNLNPYGGTNQQTSYTPNGGTAVALASKPSYRLFGFQIIVQLEYLDVNYHTLSDYNDSGTEKSFPGTVCYMKIQANPQWTTRVQREFSTIPDAATGAGMSRVRTHTGLSIVVTNSTNSKFGFISMAALVQYGAVCIVYFLFATQAIMIVAVHLLGNTSRNYQRSVREHCAVALWAARRTPVKLFQAMVTFIWMREWQKGGESVLSHYLDDHKTIHKETVAHFLRVCYNTKFQAELLDQDVADMTDACWNELGGLDDNCVSLIEFLDCALSSEIVDYQATKKAFHSGAAMLPFERIFGDNMKQYKGGETKKVCCGMLSLDDNDPARAMLKNSLGAPLAGMEGL
jgi:hypothetical protein